MYDTSLKSDCQAFGIHICIKQLISTSNQDKVCTCKEARSKSNSLYENGDVYIRK